MIKTQHRDAVVAVYMRTLAQVMLHCIGMYGTYNVHVYRVLCIHGTYCMHTLYMCMCEAVHVFVVVPGHPILPL